MSQSARESKRRRCVNIASWKTIATNVDAKLLRRALVSFPPCICAVVARDRDTRSCVAIATMHHGGPRAIAARVELQTTQTVAFIPALIVRVLNFTEKKKQIFARVRAHVLRISPGQICRNTGSVSKFTIYQFVERLTQWRRRYRVRGIIPLCSGFSLNLYV